MEDKFSWKVSNSLFFNFYFVLLFNYSCVPFLPIPPSNSLFKYCGGSGHGKYGLEEREVGLTCPLVSLPLLFCLTPSSFPIVAQLKLPKRYSHQGLLHLGTRLCFQKEKEFLSPSCRLRSPRDGLWPHLGQVQ